MNMHATRLKEGQDLRQGIIDFVLSESVSSAAIVTVVGSLSRASIRMAGAQPELQDVRDYEGRFEIVSLIGTVGKDGSTHMHISISDPDGNVIGGHLKDGSIVHTTAEVVIASDDRLDFSRAVDATTGFDELHIEHSN